MMAGAPQWRVGIINVEMVGTIGLGVCTEFHVELHEVVPASNPRIIRKAQEIKRFRFDLLFPLLYISFPPSLR